VGVAPFERSLAIMLVFDFVDDQFGLLEDGQIRKVLTKHERFKSKEAMEPKAAGRGKLLTLRIDNENLL